MIKPFYLTTAIDAWPSPLAARRAIGASVHVLAGVSPSIKPTVSVLRPLKKEVKP